MRKFLTALVVVALLATSILCAACAKFEGESALDALNALQEKGKITLNVSETEYGTWLNSITYKDLKMGDPEKGLVPMLYININDAKVIDISGWMLTCDYKGETFYPSGVGIDGIPYTEGMKLLIVYTEPTAKGKYAVSKGDALLFTLPNKVEKTTID